MSDKITKKGDSKLLIRNLRKMSELKIENLKGLVYLKDLNDYQKGLAIQEFEQLLKKLEASEGLLDDTRRFLNTDDNYQNELREKIDNHLKNECCGRCIDGLDECIHNED